MYFWDLEKNQLIRQEPECKSVFLGHERTELPTLSFTNWYWFDWLHYWENSRVWGGMFEGSSLCCFTVMFLFCLLLFGIAKNCILFLIPANPPSFSSTTSQNDCKFFFASCSVSFELRFSLGTFSSTRDGQNKKQCGGNKKKKKKIVWFCIQVVSLSHLLLFFSPDKSH